MITLSRDTIALSPDIDGDILILTVNTEDPVLLNKKDILALLKTFDAEEGDHDATQATVQESKG